MPSSWRTTQVKVNRREQAGRLRYHRHRRGDPRRPDGYTIGLGSSSSLAYQPHEMKGLAWKSADDYQSIAKLSDLPFILAVPADRAGRRSTTFWPTPRPTRAS
jgi:hypothetical protein